MATHVTSLKKSDLQEGRPVRVDVNDKAIVLALVSGRVYAMDAVCSHEGGPLEDGSIEEYSLICPWHQGIFDLRTAKASPDTDWVTDLHSYGVSVDDKSGLISIDTNSSEHKSDISRGIAGEQAAVEEVVVPERPLKFELELLEKKSHEGTDIMSFRFSRSDAQNFLNYRAGQYSVVDLGTKEDPKGPTRSFTMASSPTEKEAILITTRIRDTPFKQKLSRLEKGTRVRITAPAGKFTLPQDHQKSIVLLSGGIGVTPFRSMIKYATDKMLPLSITMFDSNRNESNILYKDEFDNCVKVNENLRIIYTIAGEGEASLSSEWKGERGFINGPMLAKYLTKDDIANSIFYICGPPGMLNAMQQLLSKEMAVAKDKIKIEEFTGY
ncbi:MAG TPA: Rieske 2Fe-2S domain-containing protein [Nitrososphaera sp.]|nr:Rieske 2Fe-2S domain-containing protein [Nitrososphaera sp.]